MAENKIRFGIKNVHYAIATIAADGSATYSTPKALPGAVSLSLDPQGENSPFYADNIVYWTGVSNSGYQGDLEVALLSEDFLKDVLGNKADDNGVLYEDANAQAVHFALMFQFEGDQKATRHVLYNCTATRPSLEGNTKTETVAPETETIEITATTIYVAALDTDIAKAKTANATESTTYTGWYENVYIPAPVSVGD